MNYIVKLKEENESLKNRLSAINSDLSELAAYLNSSKFQCGNSLDRYVNVQDVLNRLQDARFESIV